MITVRSVGLNDIGKERWDGLISQSSCGSFFQTYDWINLWLIHFGASIQKPLILAVYRDEELIGIGAFAIKSDTIYFLTLTEVEQNHILADYGDVIALKCEEHLVFESLTRHLEQLILNNNYKLNLCNIKKSSQFYEFIQDREYNLNQIEVAPKITLPKDWLSYLASLSAHARRRLEKKLKIANGCNLIRINKPVDSSIPTIFCKILSLSNPVKINFFSPPILDFFYALFNLHAIELYVLKRNGIEIAVLIIINFKDEFLAYNSFYDSEFRQLSPGIVLFGLTIQRAILNKMRCFDFLRGNEEYKYHLGAQDQFLYIASIGKNNEKDITCFSSS